MIFLLSTSVWILLSVHSVAGDNWRSEHPPIVFAGAKITPISTIPYTHSVVVKLTFNVPPRKAFPPTSEYPLDDRWCLFREYGDNCVWKNRAQKVAKYISDLCPENNGTDRIRLICFPHLWNLQQHPSPKDSWTSNGDLVLDDNVTITLPALPKENSTSSLSEGDLNILQNIKDMKDMQDRIMMARDSACHDYPRRPSQFSSLLRGSIDAATAFVQLQVLEHGAMMCAQGHLSRQLIPPDKLSEVLLKLKKNLYLRQQNLATIVTHVDAYDWIKVMGCELHGNEFLLTFGMPLCKNYSDATSTGLQKLEKPGMYFVEPVPMRFGDKLCQMIKKPFLLAVLDGQRIFLPENYCGKDDFFCRLSQVKNLADFDPCLGPLFSNTQDLSETKKCSPLCGTVEAAVVTPNRPNTPDSAWVATHPKYPMSLKCTRSKPKSELSLDIPDVNIGDLEINMSCGCCEIVYNNTVVMSKFGQCDGESFSNNCQMYNVVPMQWTIKHELSITDLPNSHSYRLVVQEKTGLSEDGIRRKFFQKKDGSTSDGGFNVQLTTIILSVVILALGLSHVFVFRKRLRDLGHFLSAGFRRSFGRRSYAGVVKCPEEPKPPELIFSANPYVYEISVE